MPVTAIHEGHVRLLAELDAAHVEYEALPHRRTLTAADEAKALGVPAGAVAKTIVLTTPDGFVRAVLPASEHLDLGKVRALFATNKIEFATEEQMTGAYPDYELGAVPPLGGAKDSVILDLRLAVIETLLVEAGVHDLSLRLRTTDLVTYTRASIVDLCRD
jgi:Ala-tRNA(Pro) deacylase